MGAKFNFKGLSEPFEADWPVVVNVPESGGTVKEETFMARFRMIEADQADELRAGGREEAYVKAFFVGLGDGEEQPEDFDALRKLMLARPFVRVAIARAFAQFQAGIAAKN